MEATFLRTQPGQPPAPSIDCRPGR
jgi:hypothetical protein